MNKLPVKKNKIFKILKNIKISNLGNEKILLENSNGRYLAENIKSNINLPPFNNSAVDGYAIIKHDILKKNNQLKVDQRIAAGDKKSRLLKRGEVARIFTGAQMPKNSSTIIMQENVTLSKKKIFINKFPSIGENCRFKGEDIKKGKIILSKGDKINSTNVNLLAAIGKRDVYVKKKIKIGFYTSGNELKKPTENLRGSQINNSNYYSLNSLLNTPFLESNYLGTLKDDEKLITKSLLKNLKNYNIIITTGGASVGEEDYLIDTIKKLGKIFFWKTAIKPGRPLAIGKIKNTIIICLPGNPVSVHLLYGMIIKPFLKYQSSNKLIQPKGVLVKANFTMKKKNNRLEWLRVKISKKKNNFLANKYSKQGSGMISSIVYTDGILEIPEKIRLISKNNSFIFYSFDKIFN